MSKLRRSRLRAGGEEAEDVNPMSSMGNLADIMLVFACGLLLALIVSFNVDITPATERPQTQEIEQISDEKTQMDPEELESVGQVYRDPESGKWYIKYDD